MVVLMLLLTSLKINFPVEGNQMGKKMEFIPEEWNVNDTLPGWYTFTDSENKQLRSFVDNSFSIGESIPIKDIMMENLPVEDENISDEEKKLFAQQIDDLFELLEMEKEDDKQGNIKVYITDLSPTKPWKFH